MSLDRVGQSRRKRQQNLRFWQHVWTGLEAYPHLLRKRRLCGVVVLGDFVARSGNFVARNGAGFGDFLAVSGNFLAIFSDYSFGDKVAVSGNKVAVLGN